MTVAGPNAVRYRVTSSVTVASSFSALPSQLSADVWLALVVAPQIPRGVT